MSNLTLCTITGADDSTDIEKMMALSVEFPFVEWGILVSNSKEGMNRFPSRKWIDNLGATASYPQAEPVHFSTHVCGRWGHGILRNEVEWSELPNSVKFSQRVQINGRFQPHQVDLRCIRLFDELPHHQFIFQYDGINGTLGRLMFDLGVNAAVLFDASGGMGIHPEEWPLQSVTRPADPEALLVRVPCGYAGGIGPLNIAGELPHIERAAEGQPFWIDMEGMVRSTKNTDWTTLEEKQEDDTCLDLDKVRLVLEAVKAYREATHASITA